ncbi:helicase [Seminavis robusta]|uniref:Helicase n=1 Tax=Seminavis robusta TaxID=568900 RepID=A0A9N8HYF4_9STRA|nr:helicase [Seminavis robusta]|eukprot:Sro2478_g328830.1 helicase (175) ;mRNA; r:4399-4923
MCFQSAFLCVAFLITLTPAPLVQSFVLPAALHRSASNKWTVRMAYGADNVGWFHSYYGHNETTTSASNNNHMIEMGNGLGCPISVDFAEETGEDPLAMMDRIWESMWESKFEELVAYKIRAGDCLVPMGFRNNPQLASWVCCQRHEHMKGTLSSGKMDKLDEIGFEWTFKEKWQ